jgi:hypothetical protein
LFNIVAAKESLPASLEDTFITHIQNKFPADLSRPWLENYITVWNIVVMNHTTKDFIDYFFEEWEKSI